jgi:hypothetical protein
MLTSQGHSIHRNNPLYNRVAGGISDVVGLGRLKRRQLELHTIRGLVLMTNRRLDGTLVRRVARRLNLTESLVGRLVIRGLVGRGLLFARGLVAESFVNRSFVVKRSRSLWKDLCL